MDHCVQVSDSSQDNKKKGEDGGTYEGRSVAGHPGDEDDLVPVTVSANTSTARRRRVVPLALTTAKLVLDIVDSVPGGRAALGVLGGLQLAPEDLVVGLGGDLVDDDLLAVVRDLEDDELGLPPAHAEVIEGGDALIVDGDSGVQGGERVSVACSKRASCFPMFSHVSPGCGKAATLGGLGHARGCNLP